jgi:hypothetical protein
MRAWNRRVGAVLLWSLAACGGGSGSRGDFGTGVEIDKATLSFSAITNEAPPPPQTVLATISTSEAAFLEVGYANGNEQITWLHPSIPTPIQNPATVTFNVGPLLTPGTYTAHPSVGIFRSDNTPIAIRTMTVTYQVTAQPPSVSPTTIPLTFQLSSGVPQRQLLTIKGASTWTATVDYASGSGWLTINGTNTFPQSGPAGLFVELYAASSTPVGSYSATLHIAIDGQTFNVAVTLDVTQ